MSQVKWFERKFDFSQNDNIMPSILERLDGTSLRLTAKLKTIDPSRYRLKPERKWSILEHIGHLSDLEPLWQGRLEDILKGKRELRPTDLDNRKTTEANHNSKSAEALIDTFAQLRQVTINQLSSLKEDDVFKSALHPRLKAPMRIQDLFLFVAEHDDHHLAAITALAKSK